MIDAIIERLTLTAITPYRSSDADPSRADTVPGLVALVDPVVDQQLWPLHLPKEAPERNGVYQLVSQQSIEVDGYRLGRADTYVLSLRAAQFDPLRVMTDALIEQVASHAGVESWEITDAAADYEHDQRQYRAHFELQATTLSTASAAIPAAFIHHVQAAVEPNALSTIAVRQTVTEQVAVVLIADQDDIQAERQACTDAILGLEAPQSAVSPLEYAGGQRVAVSGRHVYWRELYSYQRLIRST